jgi:hypothetical protein
MRIRSALLASAVVAATLATGPVAAPAQAANAWTEIDGRRTTLSFSGTEGDPVALGRSITNTPGTARFRAQARPNGEIYVSVQDDADRSWSVDLAPPRGQELVPGTYTDVEQAPFQDPSKAGFSFSGDGRSCGPVIAAFTIRRITIQPGGWIRHLDAEFRQSCEWAPDESVTGRVVLDNIADPGPVTADIRPDRVLGVDADGRVTVTGTIRCNQSVELNLTIDLWQQQADGADPVDGHATGDWFVCERRPQLWTATLASGSWLPPLRPGAANVSVHLSQSDPQHDTWTSAQARRDVRLVERAG